MQKIPPFAVSDVGDNQEGPLPSQSVVIKERQIFGL